MIDIFADPTLLLVLYTFIGVILGMVVGVLPGLGPPAALALLFPLAYVLEPLPAVALLAGIFYGAKYGGAVTSILLGIPGEADAVATLLEGYPLALAGKSRQALRLAIFSSFLGSMVALLGVLILTPLLSGAALFFGPTGRAILMLVALVLITLLGPGGAYGNAFMALLGLGLALVGLTPVHGAERLTLGFWQLYGGIDLGAMLLGLFGLSDIFSNLMPSKKAQTWTLDKSNEISHIKRSDIPDLPKRQSFWAALRGSVIGFCVGLVPCGAGVTATLSSHALEKKLASANHAGTQGSHCGCWQGLAGPEAANNAAAIASFAPLLLLGLPTNPIMAALLGAFAVGGIAPGPQLPLKQPEFYYGLLACLALGNIMLLGLGLAFSRLWVALAQVPHEKLWPLIFILCLLGSYVGTGSLSGPVQCLLFGVLGFILRGYKLQSAPLVLAFVLGPRLEEHILQALMLL